MSGDIGNIRTGNIAAATAVVGYDLLNGINDARTAYGRVLDGLMFVGANAEGESVIDIKIDGKRVGTYSNSSTGLGMDKTKDLMPLDLFVPGNTVIEAIVKTAPTVSPVVLQLEFSKPKATGFKKTYRRSSYRRTNRTVSRRY